MWIYNAQLIVGQVQFKICSIQNLSNIASQKIQPHCCSGYFENKVRFIKHETDELHKKGKKGNPFYLVSLLESQIKKQKVDGFYFC